MLLSFIVPLFGDFKLIVKIVEVLTCVMLINVIKYYTIFITGFMGIGASKQLSFCFTYVVDVIVLLTR